MKTLKNISARLLNGICIHHSCTQTAERCRSILKSRSLSTNIIIDRDGTTTIERLGMAAACVGFNAYCVQVDLIGNFEKDIPTDAQMESLSKLIRELASMRGSMSVGRLPSDFTKKCRNASDTRVRTLASKFFNTPKDLIKPFYVMYHGEVRPTKCCGENLIKLINEAYL